MVLRLSCAAADAAMQIVNAYSYSKTKHAVVQTKSQAHGGLNMEKTVLFSAGICYDALTIHKQTSQDH
jgi:hypothetical protein